MKEGNNIAQSYIPGNFTQSVKTNEKIQNLLQVFCKASISLS